MPATGSRPTCSTCSSNAATCSESGATTTETTCARLPEIARRQIEGVDLAVIHETGDAKTRERRMDVEFADVDVLVFGHSHIPWDTTTPRGLRLLNPGSPTDRRRQPSCTFMTAVIDGDGLRDLQLIAI